MSVCVRQRFRAETLETNWISLLPRTTSRSLLSWAWGLHRGKTLLPPSPLSTQFHSDHQYLVMMLTTFILRKSLLQSDHNYCNSLLPEWLMPVPQFTLYINARWVTAPLSAMLECLFPSFLFLSVKCFPCSQSRVFNWPPKQTQMPLSLGFFYVFLWLGCLHSSAYGKTSVRKKLSLLLVRACSLFPPNSPRITKSQAHSHIPSSSAGPLGPLICSLLLGAAIGHHSCPGQRTLLFHGSCTYVGSAPAQPATVSTLVCRVWFT